MKILHRLFGAGDTAPHSDATDRLYLESEVGNGIGDVFETSCGDAWVCFMQHLLNDTTQLGSAVVRVFSGLHERNAVPPIEQIAGETTSFYAHVIPAAGTTLQLWREVGTAKSMVGLSRPRLRCIRGLVAAQPSGRRARNLRARSTRAKVESRPSAKRAAHRC